MFPAFGLLGFVSDNSVKTQNIDPSFSNYYKIYFSIGNKKKSDSNFNLCVRNKSANVWKQKTPPCIRLI